MASHNSINAKQSAKASYLQAAANLAKLARHCTCWGASEGLVKTCHSRLVLLLYTDTCFVEMPYRSNHVHCAIAPLNALALDTGILSGTVQHSQPGHMHCSASAYTADQPVMML